MTLIWSGFALLLAFALAELISRRRLRRLHQPTRSLRRLFPDLLATCALLALLAGTMPASTRQDPDQTIALVVDVSTSMAAKNGSTTRLDQAKRELLTLLELLPGSRFSLVPFAGEAVQQVAPTTDHQALRFFINQLTPGMIAADGSGPEEAVHLAQQLLSAESGKCSIVLVSDGERTLLAPAPATDSSLPVWAIAIGAPEGAEVPGHTGAQSYPEPERLRALATASGGGVFSATSAPEQIPLATKASFGAEGRLLPALPVLALLLLVLRLLPLPRRWQLAGSALILVAVTGCPESSGAKDPAALRFASGLQAAQAGKFNQAQQEFSAAAAELDGAARAAALYNQATLLLQSGEAAKALPLLETALLLTPDDADSRDQLLLALEMLSEEPQRHESSTGKDEENGGEQLTRLQAERLLHSIDPDPATLPAQPWPASPPVKAVW